jgi:membrane-bound ClpP family serine protease
MFKTNMGGADRAIRGIVGIILLVLYFMGSVAGIWGWLALIVGVVLLATAALGWCPPYSLLGISTCSTKKA